MKKDDLIGLGIAEDVADKIFAMYGKDIAKHQTAAETAKTEADALKVQLTEANTQIESFKGLDIEGVKKSADEWKTKAEQAQAEAAVSILKVKQEHALERELRDTFKVVDAVAVKAHLKADALKFNEADETFIGLKEQIEPLKEKHGSYFSDFVEPPRVVAGGNNQTLTRT